MTSFPKPTPHILSLPATIPFVGPEATERQRGRSFAARIGANESVFGPSSKVIEAMKNATPDMWKYCDPENHDLRVALAEYYSVKPSNIVVGEGIDGLLGTIVRIFVEKDTPVVTSLGAYPTFNYHVVGFGGRLVTVPYRDDREDIHGLADAANREKSPLVYLANPDNPMGTWWDAKDVDEFASSLPEGTMLVLDEAYCETAPKSALPPISRLRPNVLRLRTFSKAYGLAGLRCGYAIGTEEIISIFERIRSHFGVNKMAQVAALAALADQEYLDEVAEKIAASRDRIAQIGRRSGLEPVASATNFVSLDCGSADRANSIMQSLVDQDIFIRKPGVPVLDRCIRISAGTERDLDLFEAALERSLERL